VRWDIDKAIAVLEESTIAGTLMERVTISGVELLEQHLGKTLRKEDRARGYAHVWSLGLGRENQRKLFIYAYRLHTACLKARRIVRELSQEDLEFFGLKPPRRRKRDSTIRVRRKVATAP
jgi:hypothetical protein